MKAEGELSELRTPPPKLPHAAAVGAHRHASAPIDDTNIVALPAQPHLVTAAPRHSAALVYVDHADRCRCPFPSSLLLSMSSLPSMSLLIDVPRIPCPVPFSCRSPTRRHVSYSRRRPLAAASSRGPGAPVPRARHSHAAVLGY
jgi:hypothetical protein